MAAKYDVIVIGAGPAGSSAARLLAEQGVQVALLERARLPRYKACGAGLVGRALRLLPPVVTEVVERQCFAAEMNMLDSKLHFSVKRERPVVCMSMRDKLDLLLASCAQQAGAALKDACYVLNVTPRNGQVAVETNCGVLYASYVIAADGAIGSIAKSAGWKETRTLVPAVEWEVPVSKDVFEKFEQSARFDFGLVPSGYAWVFPKGTHLSIGVASMKRASVSLSKALEKHCATLGIPMTGEIQRHGALVSVGPRTDGFMKGRVLLAGDAAGVADPVTGEGISFAVKSGKTAAGALISGRFVEASVQDAYRTGLEEHVLKELRPARDLARLLYGPAAIRNQLFRLEGQRLCEAMTDVVTGESNYRDLAGKVMAYVKRLVTPDMTRLFARADIDRQ